MTTTTGPARPAGHLRRAVLAALVLLLTMASTPTPVGAADDPQLLTLHFREGLDRPVGGACYEIWELAGGEPARQAVNTCNLDGSTTFGLPKGEYRFVETYPPHTLLLADGTTEQHVYTKVDPDDFLLGSVPVTLTLSHQLGARLEVLAELPDGSSAQYACFEAFVDHGMPAIDAACTDGSGPALLYVTSGYRRVRQISGQSGHGLAPDWGGTVLADTAVPVTMRMSDGSTVRLVQEDSAGNRLLGGCYSLWISPLQGTEEFWVHRCDDWDGLADGVVHFVDLEPGRYRVSEDSAPEGHRATADAFVSLGLDDTKTLHMVHEPLPIVEVRAVTEDGTALPGSCWRVTEPDQTEGWLEERCDGDDGVDDGTTRFTTLHPGDVELVHRSAPEGFARLTASHPFTAGELDQTITMVIRSLVPAPVNEEPPAVSGAVRVGSSLTGSVGVWQHEPTRFAYQWLACDAVGDGCEPIPDATEPVFFVTGAEVGHTLRFAVIARNAGGSTEAVSAQTAVVPDEGPTMVDPPTIRRLYGRWLLGTPGRWSGEGRVTLRFQWLSCAADGSLCTEIAGATSPLLRAAHPVVRFRVTARDDRGETVYETPAFHR